MDTQISIFSDGGARGNPGPAACAIVAQNTRGEVLHKESKYFNTATNNVAEYQGLIMGLTWILENKNSKEFEINFYMDSELVIKQVNGLYKVKDVNLKKLHDQVKSLIAKISSTIVFQHVPRHKNKLADLLVNQELDSH